VLQAMGEGDRRGYLVGGGGQNSGISKMWVKYLYVWIVTIPGLDWVEGTEY